MAQGICYMIKPSGEVVNLEDLCQQESAPESAQPEAAQSEAEDVSSNDADNASETAPSRTSGVDVLVNPTVIVDPDGIESSAEEATSTDGQPGLLETESVDEDDASVDDASVDNSSTNIDNISTDDSLGLEDVNPLGDGDDLEDGDDPLGLEEVNPLNEDD